MAQQTFTLDATRQAAIEAEAVKQNITVDQLVQASADKEADNILLVQCNDWWNSLTLAEKVSIYNTEKE